MHHQTEREPKSLSYFDHFIHSLYQLEKPLCELMKLKQCVDVTRKKITHTHLLSMSLDELVYAKSEQN